MGTASINTLKSVLHNQISDGRYKMPCKVNGNNKRPVNTFILFYNNDNDTIKLSRNIANGYYSTGIQVLARHNDYDKARKLAFGALEYISTQSKSQSAGYFIPDNEPPSYTGMDELVGGYTWSFTLKIKGEYIG